jgi:hypothetical protein
MVQATSQMFFSKSSSVAIRSHGAQHSAARTTKESTHIMNLNRTFLFAILTAGILGASINASSTASATSTSLACAALALFLGRQAVQAARRELGAPGASPEHLARLKGLLARVEQGTQVRAQGRKA